MIRPLFGIRSEVTYRPGKPVRDEAYKRFIKTLPCAKCGRGRVDPCHTGPHGTGQKSSDLSCIPLCRVHHQEYDAAPYAIAEKLALDIPALIGRLNAAYQIWKGKRGRMKTFCPDLRHRFEPTGDYFESPDAPSVLMQTALCGFCGATTYFACGTVKTDVNGLRVVDTPIFSVAPTLLNTEQAKKEDV